MKKYYESIWFWWIVLTAIYFIFNTVTDVFFGWHESLLKGLFIRQFVPFGSSLFLTGFASIVRDVLAASYGNWLMFLFLFLFAVLLPSLISGILSLSGIISGVVFFCLMLLADKKLKSYKGTLFVKIILMICLVLCIGFIINLPHSSVAHYYFKNIF